MAEILYFFFVNLGWGMLATTLLVPPREIGRGFYLLNSIWVLVLWVTAMLLSAGGDLSQLNAWILAGAGAVLLSLVRNPMLSPRLTQTLLLAALFLTGTGMVQELSSLSGDAYYNHRMYLVISSLTSALLAGGTMVAMILGHFYLVTPSLSFVWLARFTRMLAVVLVLRMVLAVLPMFGGQAFNLPEGADSSIFFIDQLVFLLQRGLSLVALLILIPMVWDCVKRQANQSATGLLYVAAFLALMGEGVATYFAVVFHLPI